MSEDSMDWLIGPAGPTGASPSLVTDGHDVSHDPCSQAIREDGSAQPSFDLYPDAPDEPSDDGVSQELTRSDLDYEEKEESFLPPWLVASNAGDPGMSSPDGETAQPEVAQPLADTVASLTPPEAPCDEAEPVEEVVDVDVALPPDADPLARRRLKAAGEVEAFRDPNGLPYALVPERNTREVVSLDARGRALRGSLIRNVHTTTGETAAPGDVTRAVELALAMAQNTDDVRPVYRRLGAAGGNVYLDLGRADRQVVEIPPGEDWRLTTSPPVCFHRPAGMQPLPLPTTEPGEGLLALWRLLNGRVDEGGLTLLTSWLVGALQPGAPYPILALYGETGSGKSTVAGLLMSLLDPAGTNGQGLLGAPQNEDHLGTLALARHVLGFDNLSSLSPKLSDALARLATGASITHRGSAAGAAVSYLTRPVILNGITELAARSDLLDRAIVVHLLPFTGQRLPEQEFWATARDAAPEILAGLLQAASTALKNLPDVTGDWPRMADFARWVVAAEPALPWESGRFAKAYAANRTGVVETVLDASPVTTALDKFLRRSIDLDASDPQWPGRGRWQDTDRGWRWRGTASELLQELEALAADGRRWPGWPREPRELSAELQRLTASLRASGRAIITRRRSNGRSLIEILRPEHLAD